MTELEMSRPTQTLGSIGAEPYNTHSPDSFPSAGSLDDAPRQLQLPSIRGLLDFADRAAESLPRQDFGPLPVMSPAPYSLSTASNARAAATPNIALANNDRWRALADDEPAARSSQSSQSSYGTYGSYGSHGHQGPRMHSDLPRLDTSRAAGGADLSASSSQQSFSSYGSAAAAATDRMPDYGPDFYSFHQPSSSTLASAPAASSSPSSMAYQLPLPLPQPYHQGGRPGQSHPASASPHGSYGPSSYQHYQTRLQLQSFDSTQSYGHADQQHVRYFQGQQQQQQQQHQPHQNLPPPTPVHARTYHAYDVVYSPTDYFIASARSRGHDQMPHASMQGLRHRRESINRTTRRRRGNLPKEYTDMFQDWLYRNMHHPYPSDEEKHDFIRQTGLDMNQVANWFINARRRKLPDMVRNQESTANNME